MRKKGEECVLYDRQCIECGECDMCDLDPEKVCDNCGKCLDIRDDAIGDAVLFCFYGIFFIASDQYYFIKVWWGGLFAAAPHFKFSAIKSWICGR